MQQSPGFFVTVRPLRLSNDRTFVLGLPIVFPARPGISRAQGCKNGHRRTPARHKPHRKVGYAAYGSIMRRFCNLNFGKFTFRHWDAFCWRWQNVPQSRNLPILCQKRNNDNANSMIISQIILIFVQLRLRVYAPPQGRHPG